MGANVTDELTDILTATAAALGWCIGKLEGQTPVGSPVPTWVKNALSDASKPMDRADSHRRFKASRSSQTHD